MSDARLKIEFWRRCRDERLPAPARGTIDDRLGDTVEGGFQCLCRSGRGIAAGRDYDAEAQEGNPGNKNGTVHSALSSPPHVRIPGNGERWLGKKDTAGRGAGIPP